MEQVSKAMMSKLDYIRSHKLEYGTTPSLFLNDITEDKNIEIAQWYWKQIGLANAQFKLIEHVFGDTPQFEEEKPKKYVVRVYDETKDAWYIAEAYGIKMFCSVFSSFAFRFDTREEAEQYSTPQAEVIEIDDDDDDDFTLSDILYGEE